MSLSIHSRLSWLASISCACACFALLAPDVASAKPQAESAPVSAAPSRLRIAIEVPPETLDSNMMRMSGPAEEQLGRAMPVPVRVTITRRLRETLRGALAGEYDAMWVPSTMAAAIAATKRFEIAGYDGTTYRIALVAAPEIRSLAEASRRSLTLAQEESPASTVATAMLSERGMPVARFVELHVDLSYETALFGVANRLTGTTAVPEAMATAWLAKNPKAGHVLDLSPPLPGQSLVWRQSLDDVSKQALQAYFAKLAGVARLSPPGGAFKYATGLTHYTPDEAQGVTKVDAKKVQQLLASGEARVVDVRTQSEFEANVSAAKIVRRTGTKASE
jgi:ABC-type phosphate/phosphonate transport system substrate-binding protein